MLATATPRARGSLEVDVVDADGDVADAAQLRPGGVEQLPVDAIAELGEDGVGAGDMRQQLLARQLARLGGAQLAGGRQQVEGRARQPGGDDEGRHRHASTTMPAPRPTVLVAPDSFKGTLSAAEVATALAAGIEAGGATADICPLADGGEGTMDAFLAARGGSAFLAETHDPLGRPIEARFALLDGGTEAVIDTAAASGFALLAPAERDPLRATTAGTGELVAAAARAGARRILVAAGGSATVDGGRGAIEALRVGVRDRRPDPARTANSRRCGGR